MSSLRWSPYLLASENRATGILNTHFCGSRERKVLLIMGRGFDIRMNFVLSQLLAIPCVLDLDCTLICFDEGNKNSNSPYEVYAEKNTLELKQLIDPSRIREVSINMWKEEGNRRRRVGDRDAASIFNGFSDIEQYTDIIIDISALPRRIYFSLIGKMLSLIDNKPADAKSPNFMIGVAENSLLDSNIHDEGLDTDVSFVVGFMGGIKPSTSEREEPLVWLPILGENKDKHIQIASEGLSPDEICPVFPYPSKDCHRSDRLLIDYNRILFDELRIEPQNIMYVPERNPFEAYKILVNAIRNYSISLKELQGCKIAISTFSSKLLSIGTLLAAYQINIVEKNVKVGITSVDAQSYKLTNEKDFEEMHKGSELFVIWLTGEPYEQDERID